MNHQADKKLKRKYRLWIRRSLIALGLLAAVGAAGLATLAWYRGWTPFMDDGPFHGRLRATVPARQPNQIFPIYGGMNLLTYDRQANEPAPTVVLKSKQNRVLWCIYAEADGMTSTQVSSIRFYNHRRFPFRRPRVVGVVDWTFGREATWWFIAKNGRLDEYWFSW